MNDTILKIKNGLIVSCQAEKGEPLYGTKFITALAKCAYIGGASGLRINGVKNIKAIKKAIDLPIIGIYKKHYKDSDVYITPTLKEAMAIADSGIDIIALDGTDRIRPKNSKLEDIVKFLKQNYNIPIMADISTLEEGIKAQKLGFDLVATTLSGYTEYTSKINIPDFNLLKLLLKYLSIPVVMEGGINNPQEALKALELGAWAVVVGTAITRPHVITSNFVKTMNKIKKRG